MTRPARRAISELLAEDVAAAAVEFITGPLLEAPYRVGKPLRDTLSGFRSARPGTQWRVLYRIDESKHAVIVQDIQHRSSAYRFDIVTTVPGTRPRDDQHPLVHIVGARSQDPARPRSRGSW